MGGTTQTQRNSSSVYIWSTLMGPQRRRSTTLFFFNRRGKTPKYWPLHATGTGHGIVGTMPCASHRQLLLSVEALFQPQDLEAQVHGAVHGSAWWHEVIWD